MNFLELSLATKKRMLFFVIVFLFLMGISFFMYVSYVTVDVQVILMDVNFTGENKIAGFNLDTDKLHFGEIPPESPSAYRKMSFTNIYPYPVAVLVTTDGDMASWIRYEYNSTVTTKKLRLYLEPGEEATVKFLLDVSQRPYTPGLYEGELRVAIKRKTALDRFFPFNLIM